MLSARRTWIASRFLCMKSAGSGRCVLRLGRPSCNSPPCCARFGAHACRLLTRCACAAECWVLPWYLEHHRGYTGSGLRASARGCASSPHMHAQPLSAHPGEEKSRTDHTCQQKKRPQTIDWSKRGVAASAAHARRAGTRPRLAHACARSAAPSVCEVHGGVLRQGEECRVHSQHQHWPRQHWRKL